VSTQAGDGYLQSCIEIILLRKYDTKKQEFQKRFNAEDVAEPMG
jgi:hypothetical protein